jgi:hypothetical protein
METAALSPAVSTAVSAVLADGGRLPSDRLAVCVVGSVARGWDNPASDVDMWVVTEAVRPPTSRSAPVGLDPDRIAVEVGWAGDRRCEVKYWTDDQVGQVVAKMAPDVVAETPPDGLTANEVYLLTRLDHALPVEGADWLRRRHADLAGSAYRTFFAQRALSQVDGYLEDAVGQLATGDLDSAVLSARLAFGHAVDALCTRYGQLEESAKWRARKLRAAAPPELPYAEYWRVETMRTFDPDDPEAWVRATLGRCQELAADVSV